MNATNHTPGPWQPQCDAIRNINGMNFGSVEVNALGEYNWKQVAIVLGDNLEANARLIAASPTLYEFAVNAARSGDRNAQSMLDALGLSY